MGLNNCLNFLELLESKRVKWVVWHVGGVVARGFMKVARGVLEKETVGAVPWRRVVAGAVTT